MATQIRYREYSQEQWQHLFSPHAALSDWSGWISTTKSKYICTYTWKGDLSSSGVQTLVSGPLSLHLLTPGYTNPCSHNPTAVADTDIPPAPLFHTHSPSLDIWLPVLLPVEIHRRSHNSEPLLGNLYVLLALRPLQLLASSSSLIFASHHTPAHPHFSYWHHRSGPGDGQTSILTSKQFTHDHPFYPLTPLFSHTCTSSNHLRPSLTRFGSSLKHPVNHVQSQNALPLNPMEVMGFCWDSPTRGPDKVLAPPESAICVPACHHASLFVKVCGAEPLMR